MKNCILFLKIAGIFLAVVVAIVLIAVCVVASFRAANASKYKITSAHGIDERTYIDVNGIRQYVHIRGEDTSNPVMIFLHGGPGSPMSFAAPYYQQPIEQAFTVLHYDQRGCGRTYYANPDASTPTVAEMVADLDATVDYARERFGCEKVVIMGHSWGTVLGSLYAHDHPDKVQTYIGVSQAVSGLYEGKITLGEKALVKARKENQPNDVTRLEDALSRMKQVHRYEETDLDDLVTVSSLTAKYLGCDGEMSSLGQIWTGITSPYMNGTDMAWFLYMMQDNETFFASQEELMKYVFFDFDLAALGTEYDFPVYYICGSDDCAIPQEQTQAYYEQVTAPDKALVTLPNTGHSPFMDDSEGFAEATLCFFESQT